MALSVQILRFEEHRSLFKRPVNPGPKVHQPPCSSYRKATLLFSHLYGPSDAAQATYCY
jgi:hypothetical protein